MSGEPGADDSILLERRGAVATLVLNRPTSLNTLDLAMMQRLVAHVGSIASDNAVRCVVIRGNGRHFMAGGDLRTFAGRLGEAAPDRQAWFTRMVDELHAAIEQLQRLPAPVIASARCGRRIRLVAHGRVRSRHRIG